MKSSNPRWALMALRRSFVWKGRARRAEAWWILAVFFGVPVLLLFLSSVLESFSLNIGTVTSGMMATAILLFVIGLLPGVSCAIRRLHDLDRSGNWLGLILPLPLIGVCIIVYWFAQRGTIGDNRYGPDPLMVD